MLFCKRDQYCYFTHSRTYTSNRGRGVITNCQSTPPCPLPVSVCWDLMPCLPNYTASHYKTVISVLITLSSFTPTALTNTCTEKITLFVRTASAIVVLNSTNRSTVDKFKLFVCLMTLPVQVAVTLQYELDFTTPLYLCLVTSQACVPAVIFREYVRFASNVTRVGEVTDVTSVNTLLQQCTG